MNEEEEFISSFSNGAQANNDKEAKSTDGKDPKLNELLMERSWFHAK